MLNKTTGKDGAAKVKGVPSSGMHLSSMMQVIIPALVGSDNLIVYDISLTLSLSLGNKIPPVSITAMTKLIKASRLGLRDLLTPQEKISYREDTLFWLRTYCDLAVPRGVSISGR